MRFARRMGDDRHREHEAPGPTPDRAEAEPTHIAEPHNPGASRRLNALRAAVLGANDGIVSVAGIVIGVACHLRARADLHRRAGGHDSRRGFYGIG
jgi:hypothetical protein